MRMYTKKIGAIVARKLKIEYNRTRKNLANGLKKKQSPDAVKILINGVILALSQKQAYIIVRYSQQAFKRGKLDAHKELKGVEIAAAAPSAAISFDLSSKADPVLKKITRRNIGAIGRYNLSLKKAQILQYDKLLSDNKLANSLRTHGWSPWMEKTLLKKGIDPKVISLVKDQTTSKKMLSILRDQGIQGGLHPNQVGRRLEKYVNRYFGPGGVEIDNIGKTVKRIHVDVDGNFEWRNQKVTRKYKATTKTYSRAVAQNSMKTAHQEAYHESLEKSGLVDHYISVSVMSARTCGICATLHGRRVSKGDGPLYHSMCHCDLKPVWKSDSLLGDKNKPEVFYEKQRDRHFLAADDLKRFNETMPRSEKLKHYTMLPEKARSAFMPSPLEMRRIRHALMGEPAKIAPVAPIEMTTFSDDAWQMHANEVWKKTAEDKLEHMRIFTTDGAVRDWQGTKHGVQFVSPHKSFNSLHSHPAAWDSPLSDVDMAGFLSTRQELQMAATSKDTIYVMTKQKGWTPLRTSAKRNKFKRDFDLEVKNYLADIDTSKYSMQNYHDAYLAAGKQMAKEYGIKYQVIPRTP